MSGKRTWHLATLFLATWTAIATQAAGQEPSVDRLELFEYGLYPTQVESRVAAPGTATGTVRRVSAVFLETTTRVPARLGVAFGIRFRVLGAPEGSRVSLRNVLLLPEPGLTNPETGKTNRQDVARTDAVIGSPKGLFYTFEHPWELVPSTWVRQVWQGDRLLLEQAFTVYQP